MPPSGPDRRNSWQPGAVLGEYCLMAVRQVRRQHGRHLVTAQEVPTRRSRLPGPECAVFLTAQRMFIGTDSLPLLAIPLFEPAGSLMDSGGIADRLIDAAKVVTGRMPSSLAATNVASAPDGMLIPCSNTFIVYSPVEKHRDRLPLHGRGGSGREVGGDLHPSGTAHEQSV